MSFRTMILGAALVVASAMPASANPISYDQFANLYANAYATAGEVTLFGNTVRQSTGPSMSVQLIKDGENVHGLLVSYGCADSKKVQMSTYSDSNGVVDTFRDCSIQ